MEILFMPIPVILFILFVYLLIRKNKQECKMNNEPPVSIEQIITLETLIRYIEKMELSEYKKEKIVKEVDFQIYMIKTDLIKEFGTKIYEEMLEKERNRK